MKDTPPFHTGAQQTGPGGWEERGNQLQMDHLVWYSAAMASVPQRRAKPPGQFESASWVPLQTARFGPTRGPSGGSGHRSPGPCLLPASAETPSSGQIMAGFALHIPVFLPLSNSASMFATLLPAQPHRPGSRGEGAGGPLPPGHTSFVCVLSKNCLPPHGQDSTGLPASSLFCIPRSPIYSHQPIATSLRFGDSP